MFFGKPPAETAEEINAVRKANALVVAYYEMNPVSLRILMDQDPDLVTRMVDADLAHARNTILVRLRDVEAQGASEATIEEERRMLWADYERRREWNREHLERVRKEVQPGSLAYRLRAPMLNLRRALGLIRWKPAE